MFINTMFINNARFDFDGDVIWLDDVEAGAHAGKTLMTIKDDHDGSAVVLMTKEQMLELALELNKRAMALK